jgi:hypothetical protein
MQKSFLAWMLMAVACGGGAINQGKELFNAGKYADARATLNKIDDADYRHLDARSRTTYALYRGLVFGALGEHANAVTWLGLAKQTEEDHPGTLSHDDAVRLKLADQQYGPLPNTSAPPPP